MSAESLLVLIFGVVFGFCLGWLTCWRFARKLERHDVALHAWDRPFDMQAEHSPARIIRPEQFGA